MYSLLSTLNKKHKMFEMARVELSWRKIAFVTQPNNSRPIKDFCKASNNRAELKQTFSAVEIRDPVAFLQHIDDFITSLYKKYSSTPSKLLIVKQSSPYRIMILPVEARECRHRSD